jgi:MFS superfamily sulfate permease-like transporter
MGIALASGVPVAAGLITGIVGGLVAGSLAGCPLQVSGPAAGLTVIVYEIVQAHGVELLGVIVLMAGALQIATGAMRLGPWFRAVSPAVIHGMLAGIGVLIFASQFHVMIDDKPRGSGLQNLITLPQAIWKGIGVPRLVSEPERNFRRHALQEVGELHRQQVSLRSHVAELIPYHHVADDVPDIGDVVDPRLHNIAESQKAISAGLKHVKRQLDDVVEARPDEVHLAGANTAFARAAATSEEAEAALRSGQAVDSVRTQEEALTSLDDALSRLRNHRLAAGIGLLTITVVVLWQFLAPRRLRFLPAPLVAIMTATAVAWHFLLPVLYVEIPSRLLEEIRLPSWDVLQNAPWQSLLGTALLVAAVASAETLLCATAVDQMTKGASRTNYDRELFAQGVGNMTCGLLGGLPMTGVIVRSSANVQAGARTRLSAVLHGVWLLVFVLAFASLLQMIPTASLAAVLVYTGYKLVNFKQIKKLREAGWGEVAIYLATLITIVVADLLTGVLTGIALAAAKLMYTFSHLLVRVEHVGDEDRYVMHLAGAATFVRLPKLAAALEQIPSDAELHVELDRLTYIDHACMELLTAWAQQHEASGGRLVMDWETLHANFRQNGLAIDQEHAAA